MRRAIVFEGHTLGIITAFGDKLFQVQPLRSSILRGSPFSGNSNVAAGIMFNPATADFREAVEQDFQEFRVGSHPEYFEEFETLN